MPDINDGAVQFGSRVLTIGKNAGGTGGATYIAEAFNVTRATKTIERTNHLDKPNGQMIYESFITGSATLQLADGTTEEPHNGWQFTETMVKDDGTTPVAVVEVFIIDHVGRAETVNGEKKISVNFRKKVN